MAERTIKVGDVVKLKTGGPEMTVGHLVPESIDKNLLVGCWWFERTGMATGTTCSAELPEAALCKVQG